MTESKRARSSKGVFTRVNLPVSVRYLIPLSRNRGLFAGCCCALLVGGTRHDEFFGGGLELGIGRPSLIGTRCTRTPSVKIAIRLSLEPTRRSAAPVTERTCRERRTFHFKLTMIGWRVIRPQRWSEPESCPVQSVIPSTAADKHLLCWTRTIRV